MAHYDITILAGQSNIDGRIPVGSAPSGYFTGNVLNGVSSWNGTDIEDYDITNEGQSGTGASWALANSNGNYSFAHLVLKILAETRENVLVCQVTSGGSRLAVSGANDSNGSWNSDYAAITLDNPSTPRLLEALEDRFADLIAYLDSNSHTYTVHEVLFHQGEADDPSPSNYLTDFTNLVSAIRAFTGEAALPFYYGTISRLSSQYNRFIEKAQIDFEESDSNSYCARLGNGTLLDPAHFDADTSLVFAEQVVQNIDGTVPSNPISRTAQTYTSNTGKGVNLVQKYIDKLHELGSPDQDEIEAIEYLDRAIKENRLSDVFKFVYPMRGNHADAVILNMFNPFSQPLSFVDSPTVSRSGIQLDAVDDMISSNIKPDDYNDLSLEDFSVHIYSQTDALGSIHVDIMWRSANAFLMRFFYPFNGSGFVNVMRLDLVNASALINSDSLENTVGLASMQVRNGSAEIFKEGRLFGSAAFSSSEHTNAPIEFGSDNAVDKYSSKEYSLIAIGKSLSTDQMKTWNDIVNTYHGMLGIKQETEFDAATYQQVIDEADAQAYTKPSVTILSALQSFIVNGRDILKKMNCFYIFLNGASGTKDFARLNLIVPTGDRALVPNDVTHDADGFTLNGVDQYIDVNFNPVASGNGKHIRNSACRIMWVSNVSTNNYLDSAATSNRNHLRAGNLNQQKINQGTTNLDAAVDMSGDGFKYIGRKDSENILLLNNENTYEATAGSAAMQNETQYVGRSGSNYYAISCEAYGMGAFLTELEARELDDLFQLFKLEAGL